MKKVVYLLFFAFPLGATAQKLTATQPPRSYTVGAAEAPLYRSAADTTTSKTFYHLPAGSKATVVGQFSPRWLVVQRQGFFYLTPSALLLSPDVAPVLLDGTTLPYDADTKKITYQGVVEVPGLTKDQLYTRAYEWMAKAYRSANAVIQMQDKEAGRLVGKGATLVSLRGYNAGLVRHTITLYLKDGRYKYIVTDFSHESLGLRNIISAGPLENAEGEIMPLAGKKSWESVRQESHRDAQRLVADLQAAMTVKPSKDPSDF